MSNCYRYLRIMLSRPLLIIFLSIIHTRVAVGGPLKVCTFNVQMYGANKAKNPTVMGILGKIFSKYDLCLIQEIRDTKNDSMQALLRTINGQTDNYRVIISNRLGRSSSKEQYAFFYNKNKLSVQDSFHFDDAKNGDLFEREPFVVRFKANNAPVKDFFAIGIHTNPATAPKEIGYMVKAYDDAVRRFKIQDGVIMGDFNADCSYFPLRSWKDNPLRQDRRFTWFIGDDADTTVAKTRCAYDRVVVAGPLLPNRIRTAQPWYYDSELGINSDTTRLVSDHYPVEFTIE